MGRLASNPGSIWRSHPHGLPWRPATAVAAGVLCGIAVALVAAAAPSDERFLRALVEALIIVVPVAAGLYATKSARTRRFGIMLIATGLVWSLTALGESSD